MRSKASNGSSFVAREVERAISKQKPIFVIRLANVEPAPALELFISGTQWIDAFPGRLGPHIGRLAKLLGEDEGEVESADGGEGEDDDKPPPPRWIWPAAAAAAVLVAVGVGAALWPGHGPSPAEVPSIGPAILTKPVWPENPEIQAREQMALVPDDVTMVGGKTAEAGAAAGMAGSASDASSSDPDFRACEKLTGKDGIEACNRAIASGKFTERALSYLYSDRGYLLMQKGALVPALTDLNKAAEIDPTNFYAYWNRGALRMAESDFASAQSDFTTALSLNPDPASKVKIEEVLNVATEVLKASTAEKSDPSVITDPSQFGGELEGSASAASGGLPTDAMPSYPAAIQASPPPMAVMPAMPASPPPQIPVR